MFVRVFRFDAVDDYELYYKPYEIALKKGASIMDALRLCAEQDRYFKPSSEHFYVKIDGKTVHTSQGIEQFEKDGEVIIAPLSEKYAKCDFEMDKREFDEVYRYYFEPIFGTSKKAEYDALEHLFYATCAREFAPNYMGDSAIIFAILMMKNHPEHKDKLSKIIHSENGLRYSQDLRGFLHQEADYYEQLKSDLKAAK